MLHILEIVFPVFGLIGIGYGAHVSGLVGTRVGEGLSDYAFSIAIPVLIFKTLAATALPASQPWGYWLAYFGAAGLVWAIGQLIALRFFGLPYGASVVAGFTGAQANTVLVGVPLILEAYGSEGAVPLFLLIAIHLPIMFSVATLLFEGRRARWTLIARQLSTHPILLSIVFSAGFHLTGFAIPGTVSAIVDPIASSALPCALIAMGIALRRYGVRDSFGLASTLTVLKLVVHPALVYVLAFHVFSVPPVWAGVAVLFASSPSGINTYLFAERYKTGIGLSSSTIALSTALSAFSASLWLALLGIR